MAFNFLATIAKDIVAGVRIFTGFAPLLEGVEPKYAPQIATGIDDLTSIANVIVNVETTAAALSVAGTSLTGEQKMQMAIPLVSQILTSSNLVAGKKIADPAKLQQAAAEFAQGAFDAIAAFHQEVAGQVTAPAIKT